MSVSRATRPQARARYSGMNHDSERINPWRGLFDAAATGKNGRSLNLGLCDCHGSPNCGFCSLLVPEPRPLRCWLRP